MTSLWMAIRLLTCLPTPRSVKTTPGMLVGSMIWFPVVGAGIGLAPGLAELAVRTATRSHALACGIAVLVGLAVTRGAPLRGLMVLTGALFSGRDGESTAQLAALTTPTRFGVLVGMAALLLRYTLLMALPGEERLRVLVLAGGLSRAAIVWVCWRFPYASIDTGVGGWLAALAGARDLLLLLPIVALGFGVLDPLSVPGAIAATWLLAHGFGFWIVRALGGLTAHTYDATAEVGEIAALAAVVGAVQIWQIL